MKTYHLPENVIEKVKGTAIPKPANEQNTDDIAPARFLRWTSFRPMGLIAFYDERHRDGKPVVDHPFNNPSYAGANILVAGENFGTGSSREHAPQALKRYGIDGIIAESYADIFDENCASVGIVAVRVDRPSIDSMVKTIEEDPKNTFAINLLKKTISYYGNRENLIKVPFELKEGTRQAFIHGFWDAMPVLKSNEGAIKDVESKLHYLKFQ